MVKKSPHILVLLREARDPRPPARITADGYAVSERGLRLVANPADLCALEMAQSLAAEHNGKVTAAAIGPRRLDDHLRLALAIGADHAVRLWNTAFAGGDAVADSRLIARMVEILKPDLLFTGNRLLDRGDCPAAALAAAMLEQPCVSAALSVKLQGEKLEVLRKSDRGATQLVESHTPCTLLFEAGCCDPRYPSQTGLLAAMEADIESWDIAEIGLPLRDLGTAGAVLVKDRCTLPRANPQRVVTPDADLPAFERILALLSGGIKPREGKIHNVPPEETVDMLMQIFTSEGLFDGA